MRGTRSSSVMKNGKLLGSNEGEKEDKEFLCDKEDAKILGSGGNDEGFG